MEKSAGTDLTNTDFGKLARFVLESTPEQKADVEHVHLQRIGQLGEILGLFGLRFCRNTVRSAESWNYEKRPSQRLDDRFAFTVAELYVLIETAKDVHETHKSNSIWYKLTHAIGPKKKPAVFLGGTCGSTTWRQDVVVPFCRANDINFFDPQVAACRWTPALIRVEERAKMESSAFIFYISSAARSLTSMIEVAYLIARRRNLIAVVSRKPVQIGRPPTPAPAADLLESGADSGVTPTPTESPNSSRSASSSQGDEDEENTDGEGEVNSEAEHDWVTADEQRELARTRDALVRLAERNGYPVFETLQHALQSCAVLIREREHVGELVAKHAVLPLELVATRYRDRMRRLHSAFFACVAAQPSRTATCDYRIPFAQAYSLLQQACADQNVSCIRSPQYSRGALLALLNAVTPELTAAQRRYSLSESGNGSDQLEHNQVNCHVQPRVAQCDRLHVHVTAQVNRAAQRSVGSPPPNSTTPLISVHSATANSNERSKAALSSAGIGFFQKLYSFIGRGNDSLVTNDYAIEDGMPRWVTFDEFCFLFAWLLESEREQREKKCVVLDGLSGVVNFVRFLYTLMVGSVDKQPEAHSDGDVVSTYSSTLQDVDSHGSPFVVHLRGSTQDSGLFDQLLVPLLTRYAVPFSIGAVTCDWKCGPSTRSRRRSQSASRERQVPGLMHTACAMHAGSLNVHNVNVSKQSTKNGPPNFASLLRMDSWQPERASGDDGARSSSGRFDSLCARLRERFTDRVHYRCPFADTRILVFAFTRYSKSIVEMLQCAQCIGEDTTMHGRIILFVEMFEPGDSPDGESLNGAALKDYNRVRMYLLSMAKSHERDVVRIARSRIELVEVLTTELGF